MSDNKAYLISYLIIQFCFGITRSRVLNGEIYAQRLQKLNADKLTSVIFESPLDKDIT